MKNMCYQFLSSLSPSQTVTDSATSVEECGESLRELCETLTPRQHSSPAGKMLTESDEKQETQASDTKLLLKR